MQTQKNTFIADMPISSEKLRTPMQLENKVTRQRIESNKLLFSNI